MTGPQDCGLVYLVMTDDELREGLRQARLNSRRPSLQRASLLDAGR
ncbi:hypothetical protein FHR38_000965 [Micromonospora polyrhachis]|uniref:Uncharacterized protein n=1 Tax=Micromonospora polyrhachis TaxID=1282883 RepID=A0A7W7SLY7_9ACTN|nr:hypothetical protein [Micromonospora polyrhachis]